jgi:hypothetical protein
LKPGLERTAAAGDIDAVAGLRAELAALRGELTALRARVQQLDDIEAIKKLQRIYGYYVDKALWSEVIALFSPDCEIEISGRGVYLGTAGATTVFTRLVGQLIGQPDASDGLMHGRLHNHLQLQGVVNVAPDGRSAKGRWRALIQVAVHGTMGHWAEGPYEMEYVKRDDGVWTIRVMRWFPTFYTPYEEGWGRTGLPMPTVSAEFPPDRAPTHRYETYPSVFIPPYHYRNPCKRGDGG